MFSRVVLNKGGIVTNKAGFLVVTLSALAFVAEAIAAGDSKFTVEVELGPVWQSRNDVRIPNNDSATEFSMRNIQGSGPFAAWRVSLAYAFNPKHEILFLAAPLSIASTGELTEPVSFAGENFTAGPGVEGRYKFNSYRATYRYRIFAGDRWTWKLGVTGKIRDAKVELRDQTTQASDDNLGFVPLIHLDGQCQLSKKWKFHFNMDGLAAPQGRAFDISARGEYDISKKWTVGFGYRMLEGGADVDDVFTFAWLHYATASLAFRF